MFFLPPDIQYIFVIDCKNFVILEEKIENNKFNLYRLFGGLQIADFNWCKN